MIALEDPLQTRGHAKHQIQIILAIESKSLIEAELTARIYQQQTPLTSPQTPRDLVTEIHMPRGVDEVDQVLLSVRMCPEHGHCLCFDGNSYIYCVYMRW
jgi:hypothetical protein